MSKAMEELEERLEAAEKQIKSLVLKVKEQQAHIEWLEKLIQPLTSDQAFEGAVNGALQQIQRHG
jgi:chaperonin cofactor prefoldin